MGYSDVKSRIAVIQAIEECSQLGRDTFLSKYGYGRSKDYPMTYEGEVFDSKAILGVAHGYAFPDEGPLSYEDFSGGRAGAGGHLARLGFVVDGIQPKPRDWDLEEVHATVADYFEMLSEELAGRDYSKAEHNRALRGKLRGRTKASVELKHQNISAVLEKAGLPRINGYLPRGNVQLLLEAVVLDHVAVHPDVFEQTPRKRTQNLSEDVFVSPPSLDTFNQVVRARRAVRVNFEQTDAKNRKLGVAGEKWVMELLKRNLLQAGYPELAEKVKWISRDVGDGLGYDLLSPEPDGTWLHVEVKTTNGPISSPFLISDNEVRASNELGNCYAIYRVFDFARDPHVYVLKGSASENCDLKPQTWRATPKPRQ